MKRSHGSSPSGLTPHSKTRSCSDKFLHVTAKRLDFDEPNTSPSTALSPTPLPAWSSEEEGWLVQFFSKYQYEGKFSKWPPVHSDIWDDASRAVSEQSEWKRSSKFTVKL